MDALSDVLRAVRLSGSFFFDIQASDPWVAETPAGPQIVGKMFPGADHLISYHVITHGHCWAALPGEAPVRGNAGDVICFPHCDAHILTSQLGMRQPPMVEMYRRPEDGQLPFAITMGNGGAEETRLVCGFLGCDARPFNPLLAALPRMFRVSEQGDGALRAMVQFAVSESHAARPGGASVLDRLSELMFIDVVRRYVETLPADRTDWLSGLRDASIGRALAALHSEPARRWTLESLGREAGLSRSALAERFTEFVGQPPMQYLSNWRMQLAAGQLAGGTDSLAAIAERVGYESEAAFSRAFKKTTGVAPGAWRAKRAG